VRGERVVVFVSITAMTASFIGWKLHRVADPYAGLRQTRLQAVPGSLTYQLAPPGDVVATVNPEGAYGRLVGADPRRDVALTLATVHDDYQDITYGPAWVYITHDLCYFSAKGDFVSPSRAGIGDGCEPSNLLIQMVDARTGATVGVFEGFDASGDWLPARARTPAQVLGTTRFH
jgi:hypothetical protein